MEFHLFLPQMRMSFDDLVERATSAEAAGFTGIALMDHLAPPAALHQPMYEAMVTATLLAARTTRLRIGHLVLCDAMRHPAVLAKEAVSLDHASNGRFDLGIGWGSMPEELVTFGVGSAAARDRVHRLAETLDVLTALWTGEPLEYAGRHFTITGGRQLPVPLDRIPIVIGGSGPRTMRLVAEHADWWNLPVHQLDRLEQLRHDAGAARVSVQVLVTLVTDPAQRDDVLARAHGRFGFMPRAGVLEGTADEVAAGLRALRDRGVERVYAWFTDFASPATLHQFGSEVIPALT